MLSAGDGRESGDERAKAIARLDALIHLHPDAASEMTVAELNELADACERQIADYRAMGFEDEGGPATRSARAQPE